MLRVTYAHILDVELTGHHVLNWDEEGCIKDDIQVSDMNNRIVMRMVGRGGPRK